MCVNSNQRSLPTTQAHCPTTEDTAGFCLLCCQPEPVPLSLSTRTSQLTLRCPCWVPTWSGQAINVARRTWSEHTHFIDQLPLGWQESVTPPSWKPPAELTQDHPQLKKHASMHLMMCRHKSCLPQPAFHSVWCIFRESLALHRSEQISTEDRYTFVVIMGVLVVCCVTCKLRKTL